jgi:hypothetical protein
VLLGQIFQMALRTIAETLAEEAPEPMAILDWVM